MKKNFSGTDFRQVRRFLCIGAHCDDTEIRAGAVARRLIRQGAVGMEWTLIDCPWCGALDPGPEPRRKSADLIALREGENRKAAGLLGMKELRAEVTARWDLAGLWLPYEVRLGGVSDAALRRRLEERITAELGVPAERIIWNDES